MNKTQKYDLSQWELTDRVEMKDFNADNAKIEKALTALDGKLGSARSGLEGKLDSAVADLNRRKLELITLLDETRTFTGNTNAWVVQMNSEDFARSVAVFVNIQCSSSIECQLGVNSGYTVNLLGDNLSAVLFTGGIPGLRTAFLPLDGQSTVIRGYPLDAKVERLALSTRSGNALSGTYTWKITAIAWGED